MLNGKKKWVVSVLGLLLIVAAYCVYSLLRPIQLVQPALSQVKLTTNSVNSKIAWPSDGQSAAGILGSPYIVSHGTQTPTPTASVAKLITALVILKAKPLQVGQSGPLITLTASDVALYDNYVAEQGSVVPVQANEVLSEYQMLEAMLLPSADNIADSLAIWAYGSLAAYSQAANTYVAEQGLAQTHVGVDASGYDPSTVSTAHNMVQLGELAMQNQVIAAIVAQPSVSGIPLTTTVNNVNRLLGSNGIVGIKTGNTDQAGGVFVSASQTTVNNKTVTVITALAGTPTLANALAASVPFIQSTHENFGGQNLAQTGTIVGRYSLPWGGHIPVLASQNLAVSAWSNSPLSVITSLRTITNKTSIATSVGTLAAEQVPSLPRQSVNLYLSRTITQPTIWWRLRHPITK